MLEADACGTSNYHIGNLPDARTIKNSIKNGVPISHAARQLDNLDLENFDLILAMDQANYENIFRLSAATKNKHKIKLMRAYDPQGQGEVPDPYYGNEKDFQEVFDILDRSIEHLVVTLSSNTD